MDTTKNIGLKKPAQEDFYSVEDFNENADVIDEEIGDLKANLDEKAAAGHKHGTDDITRGTLPLVKGGTGQTTMEGLKDALGLTALEEAMAASLVGWKRATRSVGRWSELHSDNLQVEAIPKSEIAPRDIFFVKYNNGTVYKVQAAVSGSTYFLKYVGLVIGDAVPVGKQETLYTTVGARAFVESGGSYGIPDGAPITISTESGVAAWYVKQGGLTL